jgi:hypothetical protein
MAHKKQHTAAIPPDNQPNQGPGKKPHGLQQPNTGEVGSAEEQDPKRRLGNFEGKGEHSMQEPGGKNAANRNSAQ